MSILTFLFLGVFFMALAAAVVGLRRSRSEEGSLVAGFNAGVDTPSGDGSFDPSCHHSSHDVSHHGGWDSGGHGGGFDGGHGGGFDGGGHH